MTKNCLLAKNPEKASILCGWVVEGYWLSRKNRICVASLDSKVEFKWLG